MTDITMIEGEVIKGTLAWCNERRAEKKLPPLDDLPKGEREDPESCPCGLATGLYVEHHAYKSSKGADMSMPLPEAVQEFVGRFDGGELPQYDLYPPLDEFGDAPAIKMIH